MRDEDHGPGWFHVMEEGKGLSTQAYERSRTRNKLECRCTVNAQAHIDTSVLARTTRARKWNRQEHGYIKSPEQWRNT